jgi:molybdenum cofactor cytidylyltransferase
MSLNPSTAIVILAAGSSSRMGQPKQLLEYKSETLIARICHLALDTECRPVVLVLGANADLIKQHVPINEDLIVVHNPDWSQGMSTTLRTGIQQLQNASPEVEYLLVLLVDQPFIDLKLINQLLSSAKLQPGKIVATAYDGILGVPAIFPKSYFELLSNIQGDKGARKVLMQHQEDVFPISFSQAAYDLDTPEDLENLLR